MITKKDLMNLESLMTLLAVEENAGKRKASNMISTSIDTITKYIEYLEEELGTKLLASNGRGSVLTPAASEVIRLAHEIRNSLDGLYKIRNDGEKIKGEVRVCMDVGVSPVLPLHNMGEFFDKYPDVQIISDVTVNEPNLNTMEYDIAICCTVPQGADVVLLATKKVECAFFATPQYLQRNGYPKDEEDMFKNHRMVGKKEGHSYVSGLKALYKKIEHLSFTSNARSSLIEAIKNDAGIGLLPLRYQNEGLVSIDNIKAEASIDFNLIANKKSKDIPKVRVAINYFKSLLESL